MSSTCDLGTGSAPALKPYPVYKPSGVDWLGEVPAHWRIVRNGQIFVQRIETGFPELPILEVSLNTGVRVRNFENLDRKQIMTVRSEYKRAVGGDIAYNMMRMWQGAVGVTPVDGLVSSAYVVARPLDGTDPRYFSALFRTGAYTTEVDRSSRGIVKDRNRLYWIDFKQMASPCPPFEEQAAIARYLDHADRRIRRCIQAKEKLVELLEEQRQALINEAVTGRVDVRTGQPYPEYKPSGVEWLGEVPAHWRIARNGQIFVQRNETGFPELPILEVSLNTGVSVRNLDNLDRKQMMTLRSGYKRAIAGDIAYNMMRMWQGAVGVTPVDGLVSTAYVVARPLDGTNPRYFSALFRTSAYKTAVDRSSRGIVKDRNRLYWSDFKQLASPYPPVEEQATIARYLDDSDRRIQRGIQAAQRQIDLLKEYRTRLIADVVTGKLDVREAPEALAGDLEEPESITGPGASAVMSGESARSPNVAPQGSDA